MTKPTITEHAGTLVGIPLVIAVAIPLVTQVYSK